LAGPLRFLLDNNFPEIGELDPQKVDRSVTFEHIRVWRRDLIEKDTPDWLIYFEAELAGFTGIVTHDWHQSLQPQEAFAITQTKLVVVTWREPPEDPVVSWAMVIAYMPEIKRILATRRDAPFVFLPSPRLDARNVAKGSEALGKVARDLNISHAQAKREAHAAILEHLDQYGLRQELVDLANKRSRRRPPGSLVPRRATKPMAGPEPSAPLA
jgi:hypothetical protein